MENILPQKICVVCKEEKELSHFYRQRDAKYGFANICKICANLKNSSYYKSNKDKIKNRSNLYYKNNRELVIERIRRAYQKDPSKVRKRSQEWRKSNLERKRMTSKTWYHHNSRRAKNSIIAWQKNNESKVRAYARNRRAREKGSGGKISFAEWEGVLEKYGNRCLSCGRNDVKMTMDHVIPLVLGGQHAIENIQPLCKKCNSTKGAKYIDYR